MLALHGGLSFIVQNQQLLHISANAPEGLRLICTGNDMRWIDSAETQRQGQLVFADLPVMSHGSGATHGMSDMADLSRNQQHHGQHSQHHDHHPGHHEHSSHHQAVKDPVFAEFSATLSFADLACPDQVFSELQHSLGFSGSGLLLSFASQSSPVNILPDPPFTRLHYPSNLSRAPPTKAA